MITTDSLNLSWFQCSKCWIIFVDNCGFYADKYADSKSPISLVHEIAMKENLPVSFEIESEEGPPHMRMFVTKCTVGDKTTIGHGNGKKVLIFNFI